MKFVTTRNVENNVFSVSINFVDYGTDALSAEEEKAILDSYPAELAYKDITFSGKYTTSGKDVIAGGVDDITLSINNRTVKVATGFSAGYRIDANSIPSSAYAGNTNINTKELLAQAQCKLFEDKVREQLNTLLTTSRGLANNFKVTEEYTI